MRDHHTKCKNPDCNKIFLSSDDFCTGCRMEMLSKDKRTKRNPAIIQAIREQLANGDAATDIVFGEETYEYMKPMIKKQVQRRDTFTKIDCTFVGKLYGMDVWLSEGLQGDETYIFDRSKVK